MHWIDLNINNGLTVKFEEDWLKNEGEVGF